MSNTSYRGIFLVARWEYVTRIRSKTFILTTLLLPLIMISFSFASVFFADKGESPPLVIAIVDGSGEWSEKIGAEFDKRYTRDDGAVSFPRVPLSDGDHLTQRQQAEAHLEAGAISAYLVVAPDFGESGIIEFISTGTAGVFEQSQLRRAVQQLWIRAKLASHGLSASIADELQREIIWESYKVTGSGLEKRDRLTIFTAPFMAVMILFFAIFLSAQMLMRSIIEERGSKLVEMLLSSLSSQDLMTGKILGLGALGLTQMGIYITIAAIMTSRGDFDIMPLAQIPIFLLFAILGYFFYAALFAAVGSMFESEQDAQPVVGPITFIPMLAIVVSTAIIRQPQSLMAHIASFFPPMTPFVMITRVSVTQLPWWEVVAAAVVLGLSAWVMMRWAGIVFRTAILMYGKRITLPEIIRWIRA